jgi:hypothetical protein
MDVALGRLGGSRTILVRSGISGGADLARVPARRRGRMRWSTGWRTCSVGCESASYFRSTPISLSRILNNSGWGR